MTIELATPDLDGLHEAVRHLVSWQRSGEPLQLHPGDIGWFWRLGAARTTDAVRTWRADGRLGAVGLLDGADLLRVTTAPELRRDATLAAAMADDIARPERGVLPAGAAAVEVPSGALLDERLEDAGWRRGDAWTPLERDLADAVEPAPGRHPLRIVEVGVPSAGAGRVTFSGTNGAYGTSVIVEHANGLSTRYAHLSEALVKAGDEIADRQNIGRAGPTGRATAAHLHFEVLEDGVPVDPLR